MNEPNFVVNLFIAIFTLLMMLFTGGSFMLNLLEHQQKQTVNQQPQTVETVKAVNNPNQK
ncbi:hypothetical protein [Bacillus mycoides]|uniref:hypothetical protein n=1 Tax=Bacillus mycoides TaxID=1405 RepID=UPI003D227DA2